MGQPYIGEIRLVAFTFAPQGWSFCDGSLIAISQNDTLFNLIGTTYGGDGVQTFALPNLLGRIPVHPGSGFVQAQISGSETVTLTTNTLPSHNHPLEAATSAATQTNPAGLTMASTAVDVYIPPTSIVATTDTTTPTGGSQPHNNLMPSLCVNFILSMFGIFPSQS